MLRTPAREKSDAKKISDEKINCLNDKTKQTPQTSEWAKKLDLQFSFFILIKNTFKLGYNDHGCNKYYGHNGLFF